ncbi:MAG: hypothetical protein VKL97_00195 [Cyanobacteriota bacterium]|nr:hypothetical protein [Cyanobacteriota bacterium]
MIDSARFLHRARLQATLAADSVSASAPEAEAEAGAGSSLDDYQRLQRRLLLATLALSLVVSALTAVRFGPGAACSLAFGASCGLLYLRLLARSVAKLGTQSRSLGRFQMVVPALLVVICSRVPALQLLPALAGFVLYKPALLLQAFLAP